MSLSFTILGCGSSGGVPRLGNDWGACDPAEERNRRSRCSLLATRTGPGGETHVLVDTAPDLRAQLLAADVGVVDAVLFTHDHADQSHGIDDLRPMTFRIGGRVPVYLDEPTGATLKQRFNYCFETPDDGSYPPILEARDMPACGDALTINGAGGAITTIPLDQDHGRNTRSLGFRFGDAAYSNDVVDLPEDTLEALSGVTLWIVDALRYTPHPTHAHLERTLGWIDRLKPQLAVLTNLHIDMDYATLRRELPHGVVPAFDGMRIAMDDGGPRIANP